MMAPRYTISSEIRTAVEIFTLHEQDTTIAIVPAWGNNCFSWQAQGPVLEALTFETFAQRPTSYGIPILLPFPNRIRDGVFTFQGQQYTVDPPRHGFVRDKAWRVVDQGASDQRGAWLTSSIDTAQYADQILPQFPFPCRFDVTYRLQDNTLYMDTTVHNTGERDMPLGFGIHPYFHCPAQGTLYVPANKRWELADSMPTGKLVEVSEGYDLRQPRDVNVLALDDIFTDLIPDADGMVRCILADQEHNRQTIVAFDAAQFPHVVVYTPPGRPALCIEPYTCPTDAFNLQERGVESNRLVLAPGETQEFAIVMEVRH